MLPCTSNDHADQDDPSRVQQKGGGGMDGYGFKHPENTYLSKGKLFSLRGNSFREREILFYESFPSQMNKYRFKSIYSLLLYRKGNVGKYYLLIFYIKKKEI